MQPNTNIRDEVYKNTFVRWMGEENVAGRVVSATMRKPSKTGGDRQIPVYSGNMLFAQRFAVGESHGSLFLAAQKRDLIGMMGANWTHAYLEITRHGLALCLEADNLKGGDIQSEKYFALEIPIPSKTISVIPRIREGGHIYAIGMILDGSNKIIGIRKKYAFHIPIFRGLYNPSS